MARSTGFSSQASRDNLNSSESSVNEESHKGTWTPPLWLLAGTDQKHAARIASTNRNNGHPFFRHALPAIPAEQKEDLYKAIAEQLGKNEEKEEKFATEQLQIRNYQMKQKEQKRKARELQQKVDDLKRVKEEGLQEIRQRREQDTKKILDDLEVKMREDSAVKAQQRKSEWKRALEKDCADKRKSLAEEHELNRKKRKEELDAKTEAEAKEQSVQQEQKHKESDDLKKELEEMKGEVESLTENRTEMIWLLKQAIKAEEKKKKGTQDKKPEPKIVASKLA